MAHLESAPILPVIADDWDLAWQDAKDVWRQLVLFHREEYQHIFVSKHEQWLQEDISNGVEGCSTATQSWNWQANNMPAVWEYRNKELEQHNKKLADQAVNAFNWWWGEERTKVQAGGRIARRNERLPVGSSSAGETR